MVVEIIKYVEIKNTINDKINKSIYKTNYIIEKMKMRPATFYRKMKEKTFTVDELLKLAAILEPVEYYNYELEQSIKRGEEDIKAGRVHKWEDVKNELLAI